MRNEARLASTSSLPRRLSAAAYVSVDLYRNVLIGGCLPCSHQNYPTTRETALGSQTLHLHVEELDEDEKLCAGHQEVKILGYLEDVPHEGFFP